MNSSDEVRARTGAVAGRFIPREELTSFAAWDPGVIGVAASAAAAPVSQAAQVQAARQAGYQDGYRDGLAALESFKRSHARASGERIAALVAAFDAELIALEQRIAAAVADCSTQLARHVVRDELGTRPERIAKVAQEAVATLLSSARRITVLLHADDVALVAEGAREAIASSGARLVADAGIERGGCRVLSDIGAVDATVAARWQLACATLGAELPLDGDARPAGNGA